MTTPTIVTFPDGSLRGDAVVTRVADDADGTVVVVDATPFHPVDHTWPDQPGDTGAISGDAGAVPVTEALMRRCRMTARTRSAPRSSYRSPRR